MITEWKCFALNAIVALASTHNWQILVIRLSKGWPWKSPVPWPGLFSASVLTAITKLNKLEVSFKTNCQHQTLEDLEKRDFGAPAEAPTNMVRHCLELCEVPLGAFTVEDLRLMIGQNFSLRYLIPLAIAHLQEDLFAEGDYYPGDLLNNVLSIDPTFWATNKQLWIAVHELIKDRQTELALQKISLSSFVTAFDKH